MDKRSEYSNYKVRKETVKVLQDMKTAFEACNEGNEVSNDEFILGLVQAAKDGNPVLKKLYDQVVANREKLLKIAATEKKK